MNGYILAQPLKIKRTLISTPMVTGTKMRTEMRTMLKQTKRTKPPPSNPLVVQIAAELFPLPQALRVIPTLLFRSLLLMRLARYLGTMIQT